MKKIILALTTSAVVAVSASAQSIDYGMTVGTVDSPLGSPLPVNTGGFKLFVTNGVFTPSSSSTLSDIISNMREVSGSFTNISADNAGLFYLGGIFPATTSGNIPTGTRLYALASTSSSFSLTSPWALVTGTDGNWLSPNPTDPFGSSIIEVGLTGNSIVSAGFGGPGVGAFWQPSGPGTITATTDSSLALVPEPSTYALLAMSGIGMAGYVIRRRRRA